MNIETDCGNSRIQYYNTDRRQRSEEIEDGRERRNMFREGGTEGKKICTKRMLTNRRDEYEITGDSRWEVEDERTRACG